MAGLTTAGLEIKTLEDLLNEIEAELRAKLDADLDVSATSVVGIINGIYAAKALELWELYQEVYQASYPSTAVGQALTQLAALTGTIRQVSTKATIYADLAGTTSTLIPAGSRISVTDDANSVFETTADFTLTAAVTDKVFFTAVEAGADVVATVGEAAVIESVVAGWNTATFAATFTPGRNEESDSALRARRETELATPGTGTVDAIRADILALTSSILACVVFENVTSSVDANGLPPHSFEVLIQQDGSVAPADILQQVFSSKPAGTTAFGTISGAVDDTAGNTHTVAYTEAAAVTSHIELTVEKDTNFYPGDLAVKNAIVDWAIANLVMGDNVNAAAVAAAALTVVGVENVDLSTVLCDDQDPPVSINLVISPRQIASISVGDIDVTATDYVV